MTSPDMGAEGAATASVHPAANSTRVSGSRREAEHRAEEQHHEGLRETFREDRVVLKDLDRPLRLFLRLAFAQTAIVAILLATQELGQPLANSGVLDTVGGAYAVPSLDLIAAAVSIPLGYCLALAGALRVRRAAALPVIAAVTITLSIVPISKLSVGGADVGQHAAEIWLRWAQLGILALLWVWALWHKAATRRSKRARAGREPHVARWHRAEVAGALTIIAAYYALEAAVWGSYVRAGETGAGTGFLLKDLSFQTVLLPIFLGFVLLRGCTDLLEWGENIAWWAVGVLQRGRARRPGPARYPSSSRRPRPRLLLVLTSIAALAMAANVLRYGVTAAALELVVVAVSAALLALLLRRVHGYEPWGDKIRSSAVYLGAIALFSFTTILLDVISTAGTTLGLDQSSADDLYSLVGAPVLVALLIAGVLLLTRGHVGPVPASGGLTAKQRTLVLFLVAAGMLTLIPSLLGFLSAVGAPIALPRHFQLLRGIQLTAALAALGWAGRLVARKKVKGSGRAPAEFFVLLVSLQVVSLVIELLNTIATLSALSTVLLAALFLLVGAWGLITCGSDLNDNQPEGAAYPRDGRIMLFVGYTLIANATLLYFSTLRVPSTGTPAADYLTADFETPLGLSILGPCLIVLSFALRKRGTTTPDAAVPATGPSPAPATRHNPPGASKPRSARVRTLFAVVIIGLSAACSASTPHSTTSANPTGQSYDAVVPGPDCDPGGATWSVPPGEPVTTRCLTTGLQVTAAANGIGDVQFLPPSGRYPHNYSVSVHVDLSGLPDGCVSIYTRGTANGHYTTYICTTSATGERTYSWGIQRIEPSSSWLLAIGELGTSDGNFTLQAATQDATQQITIDGATQSATDTELAGTQYISLGIINTGAQAGSAVFRDFTLTPRTSTTPHPCCSATPTPSLPVTTKDRVVVWYTNTGKTELTQVTTQVENVGHTSGAAAQGQACAQLATVVATAQHDPPVPDAPARDALSAALAHLAAGAGACQSGNESNNQAQLDQAATDIRTAATELAEVNTLISQD